MGKINIQENSPITSVLKRKANSAGVRLINGLEKTFKKWPEQFCLITGAPRSGTTAMEVWLNSQKKTNALHETRILVSIHRFIEEMKRHYTLDSGAKYTGMARNLVYEFYSDRCIMSGIELIIDKEPLEPIAFPDKNYALFLQNYRLLFPEGKLLFMVRDPFAAIWSMKERKWGYSLKNYTPHSFLLDDHIQNWCDCTALILDYADDKNVLTCSFENLVANPVEESNRIFEFLKIDKGTPFQPRPVKTVQFDEDEKALIEEKTQPYIEELKKRGVLDK